MTKNEIKKNFDNMVDKLKSFGFKGDVTLSSGLVIIGAHNKFSSSVIRKAMKKVRNINDGILTEVRGKEGFTAFVWVSNDLVFSKSEVRTLALAS